MIKKFKKYLIAFMLLLFVSSLLTSKPCQAVSARVDLTSDSAEVTVGEKINVYINIESGSTFGDFEANLVYNEEILNYTGGSSVITGGNGYLRIADREVMQGSTSRKYALEFEALKVGSSEISFSDQVVVYDDSGVEMPVSSDALTINVKSKETASTDANLKTLITSPVDITPTFNASNLDYSVNVSSDTEKLIITAIPENDKSNVTITGNDYLNEGENKVTITVLAESGNVIEYTINVFREKALEEVTLTPTVTQSPDVASNLFEIVQSNGESYAIFSGRYKILEPGSDIVIPEGYAKTSLTVSGVTITAFASSEDLESGFILIYAMNEAGEKGFYQYGTTEFTLQRYIANSDNSGNNEQINSYRNRLNTASIAIGFLSALSILLIFITIWLLLKKKFNKKR